jgi:hypothetical protein
MQTTYLRMSQLVAVAVLLSWAISARSLAWTASTDDCRGTKALKVGTPPNDKWQLDCSGDCNPGSCKERPASDSIGNFIHCGCSSSDVENCCNTILRSNNADPEVFGPATGGDCPSCPLAGLCLLGTISPTEKAAGCTGS